MYFISATICFANIDKDIKKFRKKYQDINYYYGKWIISDYEYEKRTESSYDNCDVEDLIKKEKYIQIENSYLEKQFSNEVGKSVNILKNLYEYPHNNIRIKQKHQFFNDGNCVMTYNGFEYYKINNPIYKIVMPENASRYASYYGGEKFKDILYLYVYSGKNKLVDYFVVALNKNNKVKIFKTFGDTKDKIILEKQSD